MPNQTPPPPPSVTIEAEDNLKGSITVVAHGHPDEWLDFDEHTRTTLDGMAIEFDYVPWLPHHAIYSQSITRKNAELIIEIWRRKLAPLTTITTITNWEPTP